MTECHPGEEHVAEDKVTKYLDGTIGNEEYRTLVRLCGQCETCRKIFRETGKKVTATYLAAAV